MNKELDLIEEIKLTHKASGIGDDSFVFPAPSGEYYVLSTDAFYEDVHFKLSWTTLESIGYRVGIAALSDIFAMGGEPLYLFNTISYNDNKIVKKLISGISKALDLTGGVIAGGDLTGGDKLSISITVVGKTSRPIFRSGAQVGDSVYVSSFLGDAALGLYCLENKLTDCDYFIDKFLYPSLDTNVLKKANAMIDTSDGLASELWHIARESDVSIELNNLPVSDELMHFCDRYNLAWKEFVLYGGEDFKLIYTAKKKLRKNDILIGNVEKKGATVKYLDRILKNRSFQHYS